jgi:uncharacterized protein YjbI with pentapeptide repeats
VETFEPPKYLEKLIAAINDGAKSAQLGALAFTAIGVFLLATAFSATDEDLLLNRALTISQLGGTAVPVVFAFGLAPAVFVAAHFYTLIRYDMLAENVRQFRDDLAALVTTEADRRRCRQLLANVEFVNALVMPTRSHASSRLFEWTVRALLAVFPVIVLLVVQLQSLRLQSEWVTWTHHICIAADLVLLIWFFGRLHGNADWPFWKASFRRKVALCWMPAVVLLVDLTWLQVPGADATTVGPFNSLDSHYPGISAPLIRQVAWLTAFNPVDLLLCTPGAWGCRYLTVTHRIIVPRILDTTSFVALRAGAEPDDKHLASFEAASLRERALRFADLSASELFSANLSGADLRNAVLQQTTLKAATLIGAQLQGADLDGAHLQGADLTGAQLEGASLLGADLQGAILAWAESEGAELASAQLQGAVLNGAQLQGADFLAAQLQGADLRGAQLQGARLHSAQLQGADLSEAGLQGANLGQAGLWNIHADKVALGLADLREVDFQSASVERVLSQLTTVIPKSAKERLQQSLGAEVGARTLPHSINTADGKILVTNPDDAAWRGLDRAAQVTGEPADIDQALAKLLADTVAPVTPSAGKIVAQEAIDLSVSETQRPLIKLLGCRLQEQVRAKRVTLSEKTIEELRKATGPCSPT